LIQYSSQYRILKNVIFSYKQNKIVFTKITDKELKKNKYVYNYQKFESFTETNFKFLVIYLIYKENFSSLNSLMKYLSETDIKELKKILNKKDDFLAYQNTLKKDIDIISDYTKYLPLIIKLYKQDEITELGLFWYMHHNQDQIKGRIQLSLFRRLNLLLSFFDIIKQYIKGLK